jgi:hypothetical protein
MHANKRPRSGPRKKFTTDNKIALVVAAINAVSLMVAALVTGILNGGIFSLRTSRPATIYLAPSPPHSSTSTAPSNKLPGARTETDEYESLVYANYTGPSDVEGLIGPGQTATVYYRVPGDPTTPASVGSAGWYKIKAPGGKIGYVPANVFYNDPGNGLGTTVNGIKFDPLVRTY